MKKIIIYLLAIVTVMTLVMSLASCGKSDVELQYELSEDGDYYIVTGIGEDASGNITIPDTHDDKPVKAIGNHAFWNKIRITGVVIPGTVETIGENAFGNCILLETAELGEGLKTISNSAFRNCSKLKSVKLPATLEVLDEMAFYLCRGLTGVEFAENIQLKTISAYAFQGCNKLAGIDIPEGVTTIGDAAFYYCLSLEKATIPASVTTIGNKVFYNCRKLAEIIVDPDNANYKSYDDNLYTKDLQKLIQYALGRTDAFFVVPDEVKEIAESAFYGCATFIDPNDKANFNNFYLTSICYSGSESYWNENVVIGGDNPILNKIQDKYQYIQFIFNISQGLEFKIETDAEGEQYAVLDGLGDCEDSEIFIISVYNGAPVKEISENVFSGKSNINKIIIPGSVTKIAEGAFFGCSDLAEIVVDKTNQSFMASNSALYTKDGKTLLYYAGAAASTSVEILDGVEKISDNAFNGSNNLVTITLPASVRTIGDSAFANLAKLRSIHLVGTKASWTADVVIESGNDLLSTVNKLYEISSGLELKLNKDKASYNLVGIGSCKDSVIVIPDYYNGLPVVGINANVFASKRGEANTTITKIVVPETVTTIANYAFENCGALTTAVLPSSLTSIKKAVFSKCTNVTVNFRGTQEQWTVVAAEALTNVVAVNYNYED